MSKKHFEALAEAVRKLRAESTDGVNVNVNHVAGELAKVCLNANPRFDALYFLEACGVPGLPKVQ